MTEWTAGDFTFPLVDIPPSAAVSRDETVRFLVWNLVVLGQLQPGHATRVVEQVLKREELGSTGIGRGISVPHTMTDLVVRLIGVVGRCPTGISWPTSIDDKPVELVCLLVGADTETGGIGQYMQAFEAVARRLRHGPV
jgi:PTS system fructose-specific IIA component/PTS system nitrogen regulatory IIA component